MKTKLIKMMPLNRILNSLIIMLILSISSLAQIKWDGEIKYINGIPTIDNHSLPVLENATSHFVKEWQIGGEDPGFIFNSITAIDVDDIGNIYVTDVLEKNVKVFSESGDYLFSFGRKGQGPGEFSSPRSLAYIPKNKIVVIDFSTSRFNYFDLKGNYLDGFNESLINIGNLTDNNKRDLEYLYSKRMIFFAKHFCGDSLILHTEFIEQMKYIVHSIWLYDTKRHQGSELIVKKKVEPIFSNVKVQNAQMLLDTPWCHDYKGNIYLIDDIYDYRVEVYNRKGKIIRIIKREFELPLKSKQEYNADVKQSKKFVEHRQSLGQNLKWTILKNKSIIYSMFQSSRGMFCDDQNNLWILTNESDDSKKYSKKMNSHFHQINNSKDRQCKFSFDVFDEDGKFTMKVPFCGNKPRCFVHKNGVLYFVDYLEDGFHRLFKYKIEETKRN